MSQPAAALRRLPHPATLTGQWLPIYVVPILGLHVLALLAAWPWIFSWTGLVAFIVGIHVYGCLGINLCYHRLLAHRSLRVPKWFERALVVFAQFSLQDTPVKWVANHRMHHKHSDEQPDPHSPLVNFFWSHFDWLMWHNAATRNTSTYQRYARDLLEDPFYFWLEKNYVAPTIYFAHLGLYFLVGFGIGWYNGGQTEAVRFGLSLLVWGGILRTVCVWHITWSVNSLTHLFGYRNYETDDNSRNNWLVALMGSGEGWHNNHHHDQASASVQHRWWEFDLTYYHIVALKWLGLATHIVPPAHERRRAMAAASAGESPTPTVKPTSNVSEPETIVVGPADDRYI